MSADHLQETEDRDDSFSFIPAGLFVLLLVAGANFGLAQDGLALSDPGVADAVIAGVFAVLLWWMVLAGFAFGISRLRRRRGFWAIAWSNGLLATMIVVSLLSSLGVAASGA